MEITENLGAIKDKTYSVSGIISDPGNMPLKEMFIHANVRIKNIIEDKYCYEKLFALRLISFNFK